MEQFENNIIEIIYKLEMIFPPSFFDIIENLPIHLVNEAKVGDLIQYIYTHSKG